MKKIICLLMLSWVITSGFPSDPPLSGPVSGSSAAIPAYSLVRQEDDIRIYTRWIPVDEHRSARQVKVLFSVNAPVEKVLSTLTSDSAVTSWMKGTSRYYRVATTDSCNWFSYIKFSIPWPFHDQDCIIRYSVSYAAGEHAEVLLAGEPEYLPVIDGITRISHMEGSWNMVAASDGGTLVEYVVFSKQPSSFPRWITDPIIHNNMIETMSAFREKVTAK